MPPPLGNPGLAKKIEAVRESLQELERMYLLKKAIAMLNQRTIAEVGMHFLSEVV